MAEITKEQIELIVSLTSAAMTLATKAYEMLSKMQEDGYEVPGYETLKADLERLKQLDDLG